MATIWIYTLTSIIGGMMLAWLAFNLIIWLIDWYLDRRDW